MDPMSVNFTLRLAASVASALLLAGAANAQPQTASNPAPQGGGWPFDRAAERRGGGEGERREGGQEEPRERDEIETDRDSFTPAVTTAGRGRLIFESAYTFLDNRGVKETHSFP